MWAGPNSLRHHPRPHSGVTPPSGLLDRLIDPIDRLLSTIYSLLIFLTFTLTFRIVAIHSGAADEPSAQQVEDLLLAAAGATIAWGLIDGLMYVLTSAFERREKHRLLADLAEAGTDEERLDAIAGELDHILEPVASEATRRSLYEDVLDHLRGSQPQPTGIKREDFVGGLSYLVLAVLAVIPSLVPFLLLRDYPMLAIRASNVVSFAMLFWAGYRWGQYTGSNPWKIGLLLVAMGALMLLVAIPLGG
ncbi:MAG: hypothetical protein U0556_07125 [Dehalococcoidia bacterium]